MSETNGKFLLPITFHPITDKILEQLKVLNGVIFPIKYQVTPLHHCSVIVTQLAVCLAFLCAAWS